MKASRPDAGKGRGGWDDQRQQKGARPDQPNKRKVFVGNIGAEAKEADVRRVFEKYTVENVNMRFEGERKAHCFVIFSTESEAEEALCGSFMLNNHPIAVKSPNTRPEPVGFNSRASTGAARDHREGSKDSGTDKSKEAFLANLPNHIEEEHILQLFEKFGPEKVVLKKPDNKKPFAFLTLRDQQAVADAINEMNNHVFLGKKITVMVSGQRGGSSAQPNRNMQQNNTHPSHESSNMEESWDSTPSSAPSSSAQPNRNMQQNNTYPSHESSNMEESWDSTPSSAPSLSPSQYTKGVQNGNSFSHKGGNSEESWDNGPSTPSIVPDAHSSSSSSMPSLDGPPALCRVLDARRAGDIPPPLIRVRDAGPSSAPKRAVIHISEHTAANGVDLQDGPPPLERVPAQGAHGGPRREGPVAAKVPNEVFVGNLNAGITEEEIRSIFAKYGVVNISLKAKGPKPICFVELESAVCVERAVQDLDGASVGNQQNLAVRKADAPKPKQKPQKAEAPAAKDPFSNANKLFVANLPKNITKDDLRHIFDKYGVEETFLITSKGAPYGFVTLSSEAAFNTALQEMQGFDFQDHKLYIGLPSKKDGNHQANPAPKTNTASASAPVAGSSNSIHSSEPSPVVLCVANFPPETKMADIADLFSSWDPIEVVMGRCDSSGLGSYSHAYVTVADRDAAETAALNLNDTYFNGRIIVVVPLPHNCRKAS
ncbi:probable RNA-binding protein 19 isoform X2 [Dermacentor silvarum]|uniref:probable RNA-binding protein 19 isoform X2 n=1 Tax=Dermacentor silvarum TaxID=543639 RepID=UPI002100CEE8|nr:probable RNA-binding protein 19 isoform X2 [Dermacentor silvarum]